MAITTAAVLRATGKLLAPIIGKYLSKKLGLHDDTPKTPASTPNAVPCVLLALYLLAPALSAQTVDPRTLPRVQASDVKYLGWFETATSGPDAIAINGNTMLVGYGTCIQRQTLPALGGKATPLGPCEFVPNIDKVHPTDRNVRLGGILPYNAGEIVASMFVYYDGSAGALRSHWKGLTPTSLAGPFTVSTASSVPPGQLGVVERPGMVAGEMTLVPPQWQSLLGGPVLTGRCCVPIISRSSYGLTFSIFDPALMDGRPSVPSTMLIGFPIEHRNLGPWEGVSAYYGGTDQLGAIGFPSGTRTILVTGRNGDTWCYGPGTGNKALVGTIDPAVSQYAYCWDPTDSYQGNHGPDYRPTMWAVDANDALAVKQGTKKPWDIRPYDKWTLPGMPITGVQNLMRAGFYDDATRRFYVALQDSPKVYVYEITVGGGGGGGPVDVNCAESSGPWGPDATSPEGWSACAPVDGVNKKWRSRTWTTTIAASGANGAACVWTGKGAVGSTFEEVQYVTCDPPPPPPPPVVSTVIAGTIYTCRITVSAPKTPTTETGWSVQFRRRLQGGTWVSHGTPDTSASGGWLKGPYTVARGLWEADAIWTRNGVSLPPVAATATYSCQE